MDEKTKGLLRMGRDAYRKKEYARAESLLTQVLELHEGFADIHNMLGVIYHDRGLFSKAQSHFERSLGINPGYTEAALNLAVTYNDLGRYEDAKRVYGEALERSRAQDGALDLAMIGKVANMYADIAEVFASAGLLTQAIGEYQKALELAPSFVDIRLKLAQALRDAGRREEAVVELDHLLQKQPDYHAARLHLGVTLYTLGRTGEAEEQWQELLRRDPENRSAKMYLNLVRSVSCRPQNGNDNISGES